MQQNIDASYAIQSYCCSYNSLNQQYDSTAGFEFSPSYMSMS